MGTNEYRASPLVAYSRFRQLTRSGPNTGTFVFYWRSALQVTHSIATNKNLAAPHTGSNRVRDIPPTRELFENREPRILSHFLSLSGGIQAIAVVGYGSRRRSFPLAQRLANLHPRVEHNLLVLV
jgi:hypothetical protein